ncbi:dynein regulatory complex protein 1-like, partial [Geospiza fortis]|uniref:Dynein regulatory complex protein 1-like n=1 Tax=Geospiza fortis TaxID=48883 RepID=A0A8N5F5X3_GEOFO
RLERKLRQMKGIYHLNQVKLEYNLDVLRQLDVENSTLRSLQKRKINRFRTTLELLKDKMAKQEAKFQEEKQSLESELERVVGQFQETRDRMRLLMRSSAERFRQVWIVNEEFYYNFITLNPDDPHFYLFLYSNFIASDAQLHQEVPAGLDRERGI